ncbi:hypothetical protein ACFOZ5_07480 [Marinobacter lacisalsi]|uniref:DUF4760 domain-containing protein n=1 Tax=Marinobacter lacisalsi TaxID=475979 RepID=A0ABV8QEY9_9GAMM
MLNWIIDIFADKSDQARLVTVVLSALVAIFVVLLNQWFNSRRSRRGLLIEKIEELFETSNGYIAACRELIDSLEEPKTSAQHLHSGPQNQDLPKSSVNKLNDAVTKMEMICGLYFTSARFEPKDYYISNMPVVEIMVKNKFVTDGRALVAFEQSEAHVVESRKSLDKLCRDLMAKHGHRT